MPNLVVRVIERSGDWWDLVPAVVGGIIGALAGGLPALWLAKRASKENAARERSLRDEEELAKAFRLFAVFSSIMNSFFSTRMQIDDMLAQPAKVGDTTSYQRRIKGLVGFSGEQSLEFNANDLALLVAAKASDYLVKLTLISRRHSAVMAALSSYAEYRDRFTQFMLQVGEHDIQPSGEIGTSVPRALAPQVLIREFQLETIIRPTVEMIEEDTPKLIEAAEEFGRIMKTHFGDKGPLLGFDASDLRAKYLSTSAPA